LPDNARVKRLKKKKAVASPAEEGAAESRAFLEALVPLMVEAGHSPKRLVAEFREICGRMKEPARAWDPADLAYVADLPHVLSHWHTDEHYTDAQGAPRRLPLRGPGPSLTELIERVYPGGDPTPVVRALVRTRAVRERRGSFEPLARNVLFSERTHARRHGLMSALELLRTVARNCSDTRRGPPLLHQTAINSWYPERKLPELHERAKRQGGEALWEFDRFMRRREPRRGSKEPVRRVGLCIFAIEGPVGPPVRWPNPPKARRARHKR
jgi:hypothetical protein